MSKLNQKPSFGTFIKEYFLITVGLTMYALGWAMFLTPNGMIGGGVTGFAAILQYATNGAIPISITYFVLNIVLLIVGTKILGTGFGAKTIYAIIMTSIMLGVTQEFIPVDFVDEFSQDSKIVCTVLGGIMAGVGIGLSMSQGGSTGGTDIVAACVNKYHNISLGTVLILVDVLIISSCIPVFNDWRKLVFGLIAMAIECSVLDYVMNTRRESVQFLIFSNKWQEIANAIGTQTEHGLTLLDGHGWYTGKERKVICLLAKKRESTFIFRLIKTIDPNAFVSQSSVIGVYGEGFDEIKVKGIKNKD